jgi:hypothetical protein
MATLNINGHRVTVDDGFLQMTPEQQSATVDEIAASLPAGKPEEKPAAGRHFSYEEGLKELEKEDLGATSGRVGAGLTGMLEGVPVLGPMLLGGTQRGAAALTSAIEGSDYGENVKEAQRISEAAKEKHPRINLAGQVAGNVATMAAGGSTALGARALGITGRNLGTRALASGASSAVISGADTAARGGDAKEIAGSTVIGGGIGGAVPIVGAGLRRLGQAAGEQIAPFINAVRNPAQEAERRVGAALTRDVTANPTMILNQADEAAARANNIPLVNADRGGETTRALARSVANQSPEARAIIENTASDRFGAQSQRAMNFVRRLTGGNADDLAFQENLRQAARATNAPAYRAAYQDPAAQQVFSPRIQQLMQSPTFRRAVDRVPAKSADRGAVSGARELGNPFSQNSQGQYVLRQRADGTLIAPSLEFWDHVQRNLRTFSDKAARAGDNTTASEITALRQALNGELDTAVPAFQTARQGAAGFFGADDAVDAGRNFANSPRGIPEAQRAWRGFNPTERQAFATGYASELIDKIRASPDRTNVISTIFRNQASRESMEMVFGPQRMRQIEAYVRVEDLADRLRGSMGNSTTARQLVELGLGAGAGYAYTGDISGGITGALLARGTRMVGQRADARVMENIARLLSQDNPGALRNAVQLAARNPSYMQALDRLAGALAVPARSGALVTAQ